MADKEVTKKTSAMILQIGVALLLVGVSDGDQTHPACRLWSRMAHQLSTQQQRQMTCYANDTNPCTSLRCSGTYKYTSWMLPESKNIEVDYCFGMRLNHCDDPVSLDIYLNVPKKNISYAQKISHNTLVQVPGFSFHLKSLGTVDVFLYFHMLRLGNTVNMSVQARVRVTALGRFAVWPEEMQKDIVPNEQIPVPPCTNKLLTTEAPMQEIGQCHPPTWSPPTLPPGVSSTTQNPYVTAPPKSLTYKHYCSTGSSVCETEEVCDLKIKRCQCHYNYLYNSTAQRCVRSNHYNHPCTAPSQCSSNEQCSNNVCMCMDGYRFSDEKRACLIAPSVTYNKTCSEGVPFCGPLESCNIAQKRCECRPDFHYSGDQQTCVSQSRYLQPCKFHDCGTNEECVDNRCICRHDYTFHVPRQMCLLEPTGGVTAAPPHVVTLSPSSSGHHDNQQPVSAPPANNVAIIVGAVVGGVAFIILVSVLIIFLVRRARSPYQNREMLLSDDTDDVAIIVGAVLGGVAFIILVSVLIIFLVRRARSPYQNREMLLSDDTDGIM